MPTIELFSIFVGGAVIISLRGVRSYRGAADEDEKLAILSRAIKSISRLFALVVGLYCSGPFVFPKAVELSSESWWRLFSSIAQWLCAVLVSIFVPVLPIAIVIIAGERMWNSISSTATGDTMVKMQSDERDFENLQFKHGPISRQKREIRILHLPKRGEYHDLLRDNSLPEDIFLSSHYEDYHCTMTTASLAEQPEFQALSYAWGPATPTCKIMVNNQPYWIPSNLASAIHHLTGHEELDIWIDAICINQKDDEEKSWQIEQMLHVYKEAQLVVVWLGKTTIENMGGFDTLRELNRLWKLGNQSEAAPALSKLEWEVFGPPAPTHSSSIRKREKIDSIAALLSASWWSRVWVAQELAVNSRVIFACGYDTLESECLSRFLEAWDRLGGISRILDHRPWAHFELRTRFRDDKTPLSIKDILQISAKAQLQATMSKDQIIGFSALTGIKVHYEQTHTSVFFDLAKGLVTESPDLWFLSYCISSPNSLLPSWVPDWSAQPGIPTILQAAGGYVTGAASPFNASHHLEPSISVVSTDSPTLRCKGIQVDVVSLIGTERPTGRYKYLDDEVRNEVIIWFRNELHSLLPPSPTDGDLGPDSNSVYTKEERKEAPFRTLLLDHWETPSVGWHIASSRAKETYDTLVSVSNSVEDQRHLSTPGKPTEQFFNYAFRNTISRVPFATSKGYLGLASPQIKVGDVIVILGGGNVPYVLRPVVSGVEVKLYQLVGEAYVHGIMYGEAVAAKHDLKTFEII